MASAGVSKIEVTTYSTRRVYHPLRITQKYFEHKAIGLISTNRMSFITNVVTTEVAGVTACWTAKDCHVLRPATWLAFENEYNQTLTC